MKRLTMVLLAVGLAGVVLLTGCIGTPPEESAAPAGEAAPTAEEVAPSEPAPAPTPEPEPTPTPEPAPTPGIGVPVIGDSWQVMVENAREETRLTAMGSEYTPESGYTFLVVDVEFQNLGPDKMAVSSAAVAVITEEGETITTAGGERQGEDPALGYSFIFVVGPEDPLSLCLAFIVEEETIDQVFKLQFQEVPLIPFSVGEQSQ